METGRIVMETIKKILIILILLFIFLLAFIFYFNGQYGVNTNSESKYLSPHYTG